MDNDSRRKGVQERISTIDKIAVNPETRAQHIYQLLQCADPPPTMWDMACFAAEFLGMLSIVEPAFNDVAKRLALLTYEIHYTLGKDIESCLIPPVPSNFLTTEPVKGPDQKLQIGSTDSLDSMELTEL